MDTTRAAYDEVYVYTMSRPGFILQHVADAFAVQTANESTPPIALVFGLVGIYPCRKAIFRSSGPRSAHAARTQKTGVAEPSCARDRGAMTVVDVLAATP